MPKTEPTTAAAPATDWRNRPWFYWALAGLALGLGFVELWRGSETIAPILLVLGYCVLIPLAILK